MTRLNSITIRLALLFGAASAIVLIAVGVLVGVLVEKHFEEMDLDELQSKLAVIRHGLAKMESPQELGRLAQHLGDALTGSPRVNVLRPSFRCAAQEASGAKRQEVIPERACMIGI